MNYLRLLLDVKYDKDVDRQAMIKNHIVSIWNDRYCHSEDDGRGDLYVAGNKVMNGTEYNIVRQEISPTSDNGRFLYDRLRSGMWPLDDAKLIVRYKFPFIAVDYNAKDLVFSDRKYVLDDEDKASFSAAVVPSFSFDDESSEEQGSYELSEEDTPDNLLFEELSVEPVQTTSDLHYEQQVVHLLGGAGKKKRNRKNKPKRKIIVKKKKSGPKKLLQGFHTSPLMWLRYDDATDARFSANAWFSYEMRLNDVYDPDPLLLTGGITGFPEETAFFSNWIVERAKCNFAFCNREAFPIRVGVLLTPQSMVASISSRALAQDALERPGCIFDTELGPLTGPDKVKFSCMVSPFRVLGDFYQYRASGDYRGYYNGSPGAFVYITIVMIAPVGGTLINGILYSGEYNYLVNFYNLRTSLLAKEQYIFAQKKYSDARRDGDQEGMDYFLPILNGTNTLEGLGSGESYEDFLVRRRLRSSFKT